MDYPYFLSAVPGSRTFFSEYMTMLHQHLLREAESVSADDVAFWSSCCKQSQSIIDLLSNGGDMEECYMQLCAIPIFETLPRIVVTGSSSSSSASFLSSQIASFPSREARSPVGATPRSYAAVTATPPRMAKSVPRYVAAPKSNAPKSLNVSKVSLAQEEKIIPVYYGDCVLPGRYDLSKAKSLSRTSQDIFKLVDLHRGHSQKVQQRRQINGVVSRLMNYLLRKETLQNTLNASQQGALFKCKSILGPMEHGWRDIVTMWFSFVEEMDVQFEWMLMEYEEQKEADAIAKKQSKKVKISAAEKQLRHDKQLLGRWLQALIKFAQTLRLQDSSSIIQGLGFRV
jgi:hypothetical protein